MELPLAKAGRLADKVASSLAPYCHRIEVAGSIRRRRPLVNDIDLVLIPRDLDAIVARVALSCTIVQDGGARKNIIARWPGPAGFQLDLFVAHAGVDDLLEPRPTNWGSLLLCRTGSTAHNVRIVERAKELGMVWEPYRGVSRGASIIASASEEEIYAALQLPWLDPTERD